MFNFQNSKSHDIVRIYLVDSYFIILTNNDGDTASDVKRAEKSLHHMVKVPISQTSNPLGRGIVKSSFLYLLPENLPSELGNNNSEI